MTGQNTEIIKAKPAEILSVFITKTGKIKEIIHS